MATSLELIQTTQIDLLSSQPLVQVGIASTQAIPSGTTGAAVSWTTPTVDTYGMWASGNPTRLTPPVAGYYLIIAQLSFSQNITGSRKSIIYLNGAATAVSQATHPDMPDGYYLSLVTSTTTTFFNGTTDYVELYAIQNSGGNLNVNNPQTKMTMMRVHI